MIWPLENGSIPEDVAFLDLEIQEHADDDTAGLVVFQQPEMELYQRLVEAARNRLADLELEYGIEKSKVDAIRSKLFGALRTFYQERDRVRVLVNFRKAFIERLPEEGEKAAEATTNDYTYMHRDLCFLSCVPEDTRRDAQYCQNEEFFNGR